MNIKGDLIETEEKKKKTISEKTLKLFSWPLAVVGLHSNALYSEKLIRKWNFSLIGI